MKLILRIRELADQPKRQVWLIKRDGAADSCLLHGELFPDVADKLAETLGITVEREERAALPEPTEESLFKDEI